MSLKYNFLFYTKKKREEKGDLIIGGRSGCQTWKHLLSRQSSVGSRGQAKGSGFKSNSLSSWQVHCRSKCQVHFLRDGQGNCCKSSNLNWSMQCKTLASQKHYLKRILLVLKLRCNPVKRQQDILQICDPNPISFYKIILVNGALIPTMEWGFSCTESFPPPSASPTTPFSVGYVFPGLKLSLKKNFLHQSFIIIKTLFPKIKQYINWKEERSSKQQSAQPGPAGEEQEESRREATQTLAD